MRQGFLLADGATATTVSDYIWRRDRLTAPSGLLTALGTRPVDGGVCIWTVETVNHDRLLDALTELSVPHQTVQIAVDPDSGPQQGPESSAIPFGCCVIIEVAAD